MASACNGRAVTDFRCVIENERALHQQDTDRKSAARRCLDPPANRRAKAAKNDRRILGGEMQNSHRTNSRLRAEQSGLDAHRAD
jgi:hypothetical protein